MFSIKFGHHHSLPFINYDQHFNAPITNQFKLEEQLSKVSHLSFLLFIFSFTNYLSIFDILERVPVSNICSQLYSLLQLQPSCHHNNQPLTYYSVICLYFQLQHGQLTTHSSLSHLNSDLQSLLTIVSKCVFILVIQFLYKINETKLNDFLVNIDKPFRHSLIRNCLFK